MFSGNESYTPANIQLIKFKSVSGGLIQSFFSWFLRCGWRGKDFGYFYFASVCEDLLSQIVLQKRPQAMQNECFFWGKEGLFVSAHRNGAVSRFEVLTCSWMLQRSRLCSFHSWKHKPDKAWTCEISLASFTVTGAKRDSGIDIRHCLSDMSVCRWISPGFCEHERESSIKKCQPKVQKKTFKTFLYCNHYEHNWIHDIY